MTNFTKIINSLFIQLIIINNDNIKLVQLTLQGLKCGLIFQPVNGSSCGL